MTIYSIDHIQKQYDGKTVLDIDELTIEKNLRYALLGPNGAGKTTLLKILSFLEPPTSGNIMFDQQKVRFAESSLQPLRKKVVMVNQHPILFTTSVYKNLEFGLNVRKTEKKARDKKIKEALEMVGMTHFIHSPAQKLSGGETQRVALARAFALSPDVILCDEPLSSVDLENQAAIITILKQINEQKNITIIFTTHDRFQASSLAHQTVFLDKGKPASSSYENIFSGIAATSDGGQSTCLIQDTVKLNLPSSEEGRKRIIIDPEKIMLQREENANAENRLSGSLIQSVKEKDRIRLVVDAGIYVNIIISEQAYQQHRPLTGETIHFSIPPDSIQII